MDAPGELEVLHALRVAGVARLDVLRVRLRVDADELRNVLVALQRSELVSSQSGQLAGWALTTTGRERGEALLAEELDTRAARPALERAYDGFLELNPALLRICTDWQIVAESDPMQLNDHRDQHYDARVLGRLHALDARAGGLLSGVVARLERFAPYRPRLANALARARAGGVDWVTRPMIDSYHTVWFELHEDLLATLGRRRGDEPRPPVSDSRTRTIDPRRPPTSETPRR